MTLILGAVVANHVFHASDRLITIPSRRKNHSQAWDIASNKTVIVIGSDCWLVLGYTGLAYLDGKPTDQLIAEAISGQPNLSTGAISGWGLPPSETHYRAIAERVEQALQDAYTRLPLAQRKYPTTLLGVGLQQASPRLRHLMFESVISEHSVTHDELGNRHQPSTSFGVNAVGSYNPMVHAALRSALKEHGDESPERFRDLMIDAVQATGARSEVVGEDVLAVILRPTEDRISVEFRQGLSSSVVPMPTGAGDPSKWSNRPRVYTPFVLAPGMIFHPAVATVGGWNIAVGDGRTLEYSIGGAGLEATPGNSYYGSHRRARKPT